MPIDEQLYSKPAMKGDISGTTITTCVALYAIADALDAIAKGEKPTAGQISKIRTQADRLNQIFDGLTGYQK